MAMVYNRDETGNVLERLKSMTKSIDEDGFYPEEILRSLGQAGAFDNTGLSAAETAFKKLQVIDQISSICSSTGFAVWCHVTAIGYIRNGQSRYLKEEILPLLERGELLGATGLSNPMKFYAGMEQLHLKAVKTSEGYRISGMLPFVSNLGPDHWFGVIAEVDSDHRIMALVPCGAKGLTLIERTDFLGLNGTGTFNCRFDNVLIPPQWLLHEQADVLVKKIRAEFILTQAGMALGLAGACVEGMKQVKKRQGNVNEYLPVQPEEIEMKWKTLRENAYQLAENPTFSDAYLENVLRARLNGSYLALEAANAGMLHCGGAGYIRRSHAARRLREAYFIAVVTPAVKQLEKILKDGWGFKAERQTEWEDEYNNC